MAATTIPDRGPLRFMTCGSVDDGKSTLIGRILIDCEQIFTDQHVSLVRDSLKYGTNGDELDPALLLDGLLSEREQGITIDVAYRYFSTLKRRFVVADSPGHEQYTRNMATGASVSDAAVLLVDARKGIRTQTQRHAFICSLFGIRHIVLAVNKIDLVNFDNALFGDIVARFAEFAADFQFTSTVAIPVSARHGDNVVRRSASMPWYTGATLIEHLEDLDVAGKQDGHPFRMPVQWVNRPTLDFRGYSGTIASGRIRTNDPIMIAGTRQQTTVKAIHAMSGPVDAAGTGDAVTLVLAGELDIARGDLAVAPSAPPSVAGQFMAHLLWLSERPLFAGRSFLLRSGTQWVNANVMSIRHCIDVNTRQKLASRRVGLNELAACQISTSSPIAFDAYRDNRVTGAFILVDRETNETAAVGIIDHGLRRADNVHKQELLVDQPARAKMKGHRPSILWFTGLPGSGKSTIARALERRLHDDGIHTYMLDGDNLRLGLNRDLGFTEQDRIENIRRVGEVALLMADAGLVVICSFISPYRADRAMARATAGATDFVEIFVDTPLDECIRRDPKGLYAGALAGKIPNFTGIDSPYEAPQAPDVRLETATAEVAACVEAVVRSMRKRQLLS